MEMSKIRARADEGLPLDDVLIIDAHCHTEEHELGDWPNNTFPHIIEWIDKLGFDKVCALGTAAYLVRLLARYPEWVIACATEVYPYDPDEIWPHLERCYQAGFKCIAELAAAYPYMRYPVTGPNWRPVYEFAVKHNWSVSFHTDHNGGSQWCSPTAMGQVAEWYPSVPFIVNHCGVDDPHGIEESIQVAKTHDNIYLEISSTAARYGAVEQMVKALGSDRLIFATDGPALDFARELGQVAYARISDADKENIFGLNFARLLHMKPEELKRKRSTKEKTTL